MIFEKYFDASTMSVHLREGCVPLAKRGAPGNWSFVSLSKDKLSTGDVKGMADEMFDVVQSRSDCFVELERAGSVVLQLGDFRVVVLRPPFADGWEITAVHPVKKLDLSDYSLDVKLLDRISSHAEGVLVAGAPGQGKSTFAQALAVFYLAKGKIVKTVEAPRDLVLPDSITQLAISHGSAEEVHDVLLLSRPDYTIFDEMRNTSDFALFSDLRLSGVGMIGVVHATCELDAIQRFIGRIDLGVIPHVIDTVIFIKSGGVARVLSVAMVVKVPSGMTEDDLARPVVVVSDFMTNAPVAEVYSYGEETVVVPVVKTQASGVSVLAAKAIERALQGYSENVRVEMAGSHKAVVYVDEKDIAAIIGREGKNVSRLEKELGVGLDIRALEDVEDKGKGSMPSLKFRIGGSSKHVEILLEDDEVGKDVDLYVEGEFAATVNIGKNNSIKVKKSNKLGKLIMRAVQDRTLEIFKA